VRTRARSPARRLRRRRPRAAARRHPHERAADRRGERGWIQPARRAHGAAARGWRGPVGVRDAGRLPHHRAHVPRAGDAAARRARLAAERRGEGVRRVRAAGGRPRDPIRAAPSWL
ncbi:MAG: hypothetical protein AVDCRST_MAG11-3388, partial [uncultured Gemmatimonadaceae bacterium]